MLKIYTKKIKQLNPRKVTQSTDILSTSLKENTDILLAYVCNFVYETMRGGKFASFLRHASITPIFKERFQGIEKKQTAFCYATNCFKIF